MSKFSGSHKFAGPRLPELVLIGLILLGPSCLYSHAKNMRPASLKTIAKEKPMPPAYAEAVKAFNGGKYKDALEKFQRLDASGFCCDKVHYFIAQSYQGMNQTAPAALNYQWVCLYSKDPTLTYYSQVALSQLAYYQGHRTYQGNGNNFARVAANSSSGGGMVGG